MSQSPSSPGKTGYKWLILAVSFTGSINITLAIINLLPIPALDGGKLLMYLGEKVHYRFVKLHIPFSVAGWVVIVGITIYTVIIDVVKLTV